VAKAKRAITEFQKASADLRGTADLMIYFVERGVEFCSDHTYVEDALQGSMLRMYARAIQAVDSLPESENKDFHVRLLQIAEHAGFDPVFGDAIRETYDDAFGTEYT
jgi:hypothetical protein